LTVLDESKRRLFFALQFFAAYPAIGNLAWQDTLPGKRPSWASDILFVKWRPKNIYFRAFVWSGIFRLYVVSFHRRVDFVLTPQHAIF
jgi:hypothetical protein